MLLATQTENGGQLQESISENQPNPMAALPSGGHDLNDDKSDPPDGKVEL